MHGLENDFVIVDGPRELTADDARQWCDRRTGIGADGALVIVPAADGVRMTYRNADGSHAETCGNGVRCVARLARDRGWVDDDAFIVHTDAGPAPVEVRSGGVVRARLADRAVIGDTVEIAGTSYLRVSLGNPHAVALVDDVFAVPLGAVGPIVEGDTAFPDRTNVEIINAVEGGGVAARIWERGVGETRASGTGAAAAAAAGRHYGISGDATDVHLLGGVLRVELAEDGVWTEGATAYVFRGELET